jgi:gamma-glutamylputrescine oxidase
VSDPVWEDGGWTGLPRLGEDVTADVCVVGLGGSGLTAVQELRARGASVVGLDAGQVGGGAAGRNGGFLLAGLARAHHEVVAQVGRERAARLYQQTVQEMDRMTAATPECVRRTGSLRIERTAEGLADCAAQSTALRADGFAVQHYDGPEGSGLLFPHDGILQPLRRCRQLATGPGLYERSPALEVGAGLVVTDRARVSCGAILVCVDGRLAQLLPEVPVRTVRLQMLATAPVPHRYDRPVYLRGGYEYWQQLPDGRLAMGGFRDVGGDEEETTSAAPSPAVQGALDGLLAQVAPGAVVTHRWAASVGYTQDALPYLGEVRQGVWAAGGYCGTGNVVGALCARQLVSEVLGGPAYFG